MRIERCACEEQPARPVRRTHAEQLAAMDQPHASDPTGERARAPDVAADITDFQRIPVTEGCRVRWPEPRTPRPARGGRPTLRGRRAPSRGRARPRRRARRARAPRSTHGCSRFCAATGPKAQTPSDSSRVGLLSERGGDWSGLARRSSGRRRTFDTERGGAPPHALTVSSLANPPGMQPSLRGHERRLAPRRPPDSTPRRRPPPEGSWNVSRRTSGPALSVPEPFASR